MGSTVQVSLHAPMAVAQPFLAVRLEAVFDDCFAERWNTRLLGGADEPVYRPALTTGACHTLRYRQDFFASALHEVAHWCIAGVQRRRQCDFGYWYAPDGRSAEQQGAFETVEYRPQALEWFFSRACGYRFRVSVDNLSLDNRTVDDRRMDSQGMDRPAEPTPTDFQRRVLEQALHWQHRSLPHRAALFYAHLCREFGTAVPANVLQFSFDELL